ncbi:hypothetical protein GCM10017083_49680 [Thalassobaculum fulvum]|uniref:Uncharacterized protein n=1 Tax=Thalassobaculum fulvum TaxID=1633335 RepID=A0A919CTK3_9PROT|nr:hypothetical protein [Thalassobaculum fulvum]GHD61809.1 hypothetical protein GCM10017083_49680 [Thalassobaculum fulvum]
MRPVAAVVLVLGLASAAAGLAIAVVGFAPIPFGDSLSFFRKFFDAGGWDGYGLAELYRRHNEHRIVVPSLFFLLDIGLFRAGQAFLIAVIVVSSLAHAAVLAWLFRRLGHRGPLLAAFAAIAAGTALSPLAWENLVWSFQVQFIQVWLFATLAFAALAVGDGGQWRRVGGAVVFGLASTYTMANGLAVWPLLVGLAWWRGVRGAPFWLLAAVAAAVVAVEVTGFRPHGTHSDPAETLLQPLAVGHYALRYLTTAVAALGPTARDVLGGVLVLAVGGLAVDAVARPARYRAEHGVLLALAGFVIAAALLTALGRVGFGLAQADASRYATPSLLFLVVVLALALDRVAGRPSWAMAGAGGAAAVLLVPGLILAWKDLPAIAGSRDSRVNAIVEYLAGGYRPAAALSLFPRSSVVPARVLERLDAAGLGPFAERARFMPPADALRDPGRPLAAMCRGAVDGAVSDPVNGVQVWGWAADTASDAQPRWIVATGADDTVVAWGASLVWRPDVAAALGTRWGGRGFMATGDQAVDGPLTVYGVFDDGRRCAIATGIAAVPPRFLSGLPASAHPASGAWTVTDGGGPAGAGPGDPPPAATPAVGSLGLPSSRFEATLDLIPSAGPAELLVPVRTGPYPVGVTITVIDPATGGTLDGHGFGRPSADGWTWLVLRGTRSAPGHLLRLRATATGEGPWQGVAVGRPYWLPAAPQG